MVKLSDLDNDEMRMEVFILSTTASVYHRLNKNPIVQELKKVDLNLEELVEFVNSRTTNFEKGYRSMQDSTLTALACVLEDKYRHGNPSDPVVRFAEDFMVGFSATRIMEFAWTHRVCRGILEDEFKPKS